MPLYNKYHPIAVSRVTEGTGLRKMAGSRKVRTKDIAVFARQFYTMLNAGIPIVTCLDILRKQTKNNLLKEALVQVDESVQAGSSLSESLKDHKNVFPELFIYMMEAGEVSGTLESIMERMAVHYEKESKMQRKIAEAMAYPVLLVIVSVVVVVFMLIAILPTFLSMFEGNGILLPAPTRLLLHISNALRHHGPALLLIGIAVGYTLRRSVRTDSGRKSLDQLKLKLPVVKNLVMKSSVFRFTRTLSILLASGIPLLSAMKIVAKVVGNRVVADAILTIREDLRKGFDLSGSIQRQGIFPFMVVSMVQVGEASGTLDDVLSRTADYYEEETDAAIQKMTTMLEPVMLILMAVVIGFIVIAMYLPMIDMMQTIQ
ncbi:type II secretion system F family protein [Eubacteriales bacterium mix99]|jgi:type IV pilus assembly protein PilC